MLGAICIMLVLALVTTSLWPGSEQDAVGIRLLSSIAFLLAGALLLGRYPGGPTLKQALAIHASHPLAIFLGGGIGLLAQVPAEILQRWLSSQIPHNQVQVDSISQLTTSLSPQQEVALPLVLIVLVPLCEEAFFRGGIYGALRRGQNREGLSAFVVALGFALCHFSPQQFLSLLFFAFVVGILRVFSGSLLPGLAAHATFNAAAWAGQKLPAFHPQGGVSPLAQGALLLTLFFLIFIYIRFVGRHPVSLRNRNNEVFPPTAERTHD